MKLDLTIRSTTELGVALSFVAVLAFAGCGGGGSSDNGRSLLQMGGAKQGGGLNLIAAVSTLAGSSAAASGAIDASGVSATFNYPQGIASDGKNLYVADSFNNTIRKIVIETGVVTTLAGSSATVAGSLDGVGTAALFWEPTGITTDGTYLYVTDNNNHTIRKVKIDTSEVTTLAGVTGVSGVADTASGVQATFNYPTGITTDGTNLYVTDSSSNTIRKITIASGVVSTVAGSSVAEAGLSDSVVVPNPNLEEPNKLLIDNTTARFWQPSGITTDGSNLYVADSFNNVIRKITIASGVVSTLAGSNLAQHGMADSVVIPSPTDPSILIYDGSTARFWQPVGITTDGSNLYVADTVNNSIRKILIATGRVITLAAASSAGAPGTSDSSDGWLAKFNHPRGITTDGTSLYVSDSLNKTIRKIQ